MAEQKGLRFDGICIKCGKPIKGFQNHPYDFDKGAQYSRKPRLNGLQKATWHRECESLPDNPETVTILLERQRKHFAIMSHGGYSHSYKPAPSVPVPEEFETVTDETPTTETTTESTGMTPEQIQEIIASAVSSAVATATGKPVPTPAKVSTPVSVKTISTRSEWYEKFDAVVACGMTRILLVGPPGTGKSRTADRDGLRVTCHEDAGPESLVGTFIQKDGNTVWVEGPSQLAMENGTRIVLDEIDHTSSECVSLLYALLDDSPSIVIPTGKNVKAVKGYQTVCTMNGNPSDLPDAILDRIECIIVADVPHPNAIATVKGSPLGDKLVALTQNYYRGLDKSGFSWKGNPTLRRVRNFGKLISAGLNQDVAAQCVFGNSWKEITSALTTVR